MNFYKTNYFVAVINSDNPVTDTGRTNLKTVLPGHRYDIITPDKSLVI